MAAIKIENLCKTFEYYEKGQGLQGSVRNLFFRKKLKKEAVKDLNFTVQQGEIVGFLGPNGAGKTTSLKMLSGILHPSSGRAEVLGYTPWERKNDFKRRISIIMGQKNQLWWDLPAIDSMNLNKQIYQIDEGKYKQRLAEMTVLLNVEKLLNIQVRRLSLGERMKMEIIAALLHQPEVLFLDEPTIGLDIISQKGIREFLKKYNAATGVTILLTSHYMDDISDLCRRSVVINHGEVIYDAETEQIRGRLGNKKLVKLKLEAAAEMDFSEYGIVRERQENEIILEVEKEKVKEIIKELLTKYMVTDFSVEDVPLEEGVAALYQAG